MKNFWYLILIVFFTFISCEKDDRLIRCWKTANSEYVPYSVHSNWCCHSGSQNGCNFNPVDHNYFHLYVDEDGEPCEEEEWNNY
tara:strand:+ start:105 stop:356 length:252 start_codon:yes stop_codon:yes gene_type:complete